MSKNSSKSFWFISVAIAIASALALFDYNIEYKPWAANLPLPHSMHLSEALEKKAKFLDIKLNTNIKNYKNFNLLPVEEYGILPSEQGLSHNIGIGRGVWVYTKNDNKYANALGEQNEIMTLYYKYSSEYALYIYTFNNIIYRIAARLEKGPISFNKILYKSYGPCVYDNLFKNVDYNDEVNMSWESKNVSLDLDYTCCDGGIMTLTYAYKPAIEKMDSIYFSNINSNTREAASKL